MDAILRFVLTLSVSGSLVAAVLILLRKLLRGRLGFTWHYYLWLIVILRLLVPFAPSVNLLSAVGGVIAGPATQMVAATAPEEQGTVEWAESALPVDDGNAAEMAATEEAAAPAPFWGQPLELRLGVFTYLGILWAAVALLLLVYKIGSYLSYTRALFRTKHAVEHEGILADYHEAATLSGSPTMPPIFHSSLAEYPMMVGVFRPYIFIPDEVNRGDMKQIFLHELVHYRRRDTVYKWLVHVTVCLHWFNPLVHLVARLAEKDCELSCDEAVVKRLDGDQLGDYGDMLLRSLQVGVDRKGRFAENPLSANALFMKERLGNLMSYKKKGKKQLVSSVCLAAVLVCVAVFTGGYPLQASAVKTNVTQAASGDNAGVTVRSSSGGASATPNLTGGSVVIERKDVHTLDISSRLGGLTVRQGDALKIEVGDKLRDLAVWELKSGTLRLYDTVGDSFSILDDTLVYHDAAGNAVSVPGYRKDDYRVVVTLPKDSPTYIKVSLNAGIQSLNASGINAKEIELRSDGGADIRDMQGETLRFQHNFGGATIRDCTATGALEYTGDSDARLEKISAASMDVKMNFGTFKLADSKIAGAFTYKGDANRQFEKVTAGSIEVNGNFGKTTVERSEVLGAFSHTGDSSVTMTNTKLGSVQLDYNFADIVATGITVRDGMDIVSQDSGKAELSGDIKGNISIRAGNFDTIKLQLTTAKRADYAVKTTGFTSTNKFSDTGFTLNGQEIGGDISDSAAAPYTMEITSHRDFGKGLTIQFGK